MLPLLPTAQPVLRQLSTCNNFGNPKPVAQKNTMANDHFKKQLEAILKVQLEGNNPSAPDPNRKPGKPFVARKGPTQMFFPPPPPPPGAGKGLPPSVAAIGGVPAVGGGSGVPDNNWTYFIALKIDSLLPLGQLLENIEGVCTFCVACQLTS